MFQLWIAVHWRIYAEVNVEAQQCSNPILLRVESRAGHGAGTSKEKQIDEIADIFGYALNVIRGN